MSFYSVFGNLSVVGCGSTTSMLQCISCTTSVDCKSLTKASTVSGRVYVAACVLGRCRLLLVGPLLSPISVVFNVNETRNYNPTYAAAADTVTETVSVLACVNTPAALRFFTSSYRAAAVCLPGSAGGAAGGAGVVMGPQPGAELGGHNYTQIAIDAVESAQSLLLPMLILSGSCKLCSPGYSAQYYASAVCSPCAPGTSQPEKEASMCNICEAGTYQPQAGATACIACSANTPTTLSIGASSSSACFTATVGIDTAWVVGQFLSLSVYWTLLPLGDAGINDIVAIFFISPTKSSSALRQLAWTYTSVPDTPADYSGGSGPGSVPVSRGSITLTVPSAGEGIYAVHYFRNSSDPAIPDLVPEGGGVIASASYYTASGVPPQSQPAGASPLPLNEAATQLPADMGLEVDDGGLVCPAGTLTPYPSDQPDGGG